MTMLPTLRRRPAPAGCLLLAALLTSLIAAGPAGASTRAAAPSPAPSPSGSVAGKAPAKPPKASITWAVQPSTSKGPDGRSTYNWPDLKPGTVVHDYVGVSNFKATPVTFQVYATDAFVTSSGNLDLLSAATKPVDVGSWVHFLHNTVIVPGHARVNEPFTLTVPRNATPGDHTGGVLASTTRKGVNNQGTSVTVDSRIGVPIYLRVSGPLHPVLGVESLSVGYHSTINPFGGGATNVSYTVHNTGNVRLTGTQTVTITGPFGVTLATAHPKPLLQLLPGQSFRVHAHVSGVFPAGPLTVHVQVHPVAVAGLSHTGTAYRMVSHSAGMFAIPWPQLLLLVVLAGAGVGAWWWVGRMRRNRAATLAAAVEKGRREALVESAATDLSPPVHGLNGVDDREEYPAGATSVKVAINGDQVAGASRLSGSDPE
jgi:hypothetical protein